MPLITPEKLLPEEAVVAVLSKVGRARIIDDFKLAKIFDRASKASNGVFKQFAWDPQYRYSPVLTDVLQALDHGGSIRRDNPAGNYFSITKHTTGPYGNSLYERLSADDKAVADKIAAEIQTAYGVSDDT